MMVMRYYVVVHYSEGDSTPAQDVQWLSVMRHCDSVQLGSLSSLQPVDTCEDYVQQSLLPQG